eukprot:gene36651-9062_t
MVTNIIRKLIPNKHKPKPNRKRKAASPAQPAARPADDPSLLAAPPPAPPPPPADPSPCAHDPSPDLQAQASIAAMSAEISQLKHTVMQQSAMIAALQATQTSYAEHQQSQCSNNRIMQSQISELHKLCKDIDRRLQISTCTPQPPGAGDAAPPAVPEQHEAPPRPQPSPPPPESPQSQSAPQGTHMQHDQHGQQQSQHGAHSQHAQCDTHAQYGSHHQHGNHAQHQPHPYQHGAPVQHSPHSYQHGTHAQPRPQSMPNHSIFSINGQDFYKSPRGFLCDLGQAPPDDCKFCRGGDHWAVVCRHNPRPPPPFLHHGPHAPYVRPAPPPTVLEPLSPAPPPAAIP